MKPDMPLSWIGTTTRKRDQGLYHIIALAHKQGHTIAVAACGTRPFAYGGSFPDTGPLAPSQGPRCQRCEAMAAKLRKGVR